MAALDVLVVQHVVALRYHARRHLARVPRVHAVVARGRGEEDRRVVRLLVHVLVRAVLRDPGPLRGQVGVAVLGHPRRAGQQLVVALHVQQRHLAADGVEQLGALHRDGAHQQAAVAAALDAQVARAGHLRGDQVLGHGLEVVVAALLELLDGRLVPGRPVLAAAADVGDDPDAAVFVPGLADAARVAGRQRDLEAAVAVQQRRVLAIGLRALGPDDEVGHLGAVPGRGELLLDAHARRVEEVRARLQQLALVAVAVGQVQRIGRQEVGVAEEVGLGQRVVPRVRVVQLVGGQRAGEGRRDGAVLPALGRRRDLLDTAGDVVQHVEDHLGARRAVAGQRARGGGREQRLEMAIALQVVGGVAHQQRAARPGPVARGPVGAQLDQHAVAPEREVGVVRLVDERQLRRLARRVEVRQQPDARGVEVERAAEGGALVAGRVVHVHAGGDVGVLALEHRRGAGQRRAARPALDHARIARIGEAAGAEIGRHVERVLIGPVHAGLGLGQREAVGDERPLGDVELAHHVRVGAAARQHDHAAFVLRREAVGAGPDPVLVLLLRQRVEVDHDVPRGLRLAVLVQRGAAPQAARVLVVAPEVPEPLAAAHDARDLLLGVEDGAQLGSGLVELRPCFDDLARLRVALAHPREGLVAEHVLQPQVGVVGGRRRRGSRRSGSGWGLGHECRCGGGQQGGHGQESECLDHRRGGWSNGGPAHRGRAGKGAILTSMMPARVSGPAA